MPVNKPKFEFICRADGEKNKVFVLKNVSSLFVSNIQFESFEIVFHDGYVENINCLEMRLPSSLAPNESSEFICIKVWQNIIDPTSGRVHDSTGLVALDGIRYGPVHEVTEITSSLDAELLAEFVRLNPNYRFDRHELHTDEEDI